MRKLGPLLGAMASGAWLDAAWSAPSRGVAAGCLILSAGFFAAAWWA